MKYILLVLFLLPFSCFSQRSKYLVYGSYTSARDIRSGFGAGIIAGFRVFEGTHVGPGVEALSFESLDGVIVPLTLNFLYIGSASNGKVSFIGDGALGYRVHNKNYRTVEQRGWLYSSLMVGIKSNGNKINPFVMAGYSKSYLKYSFEPFRHSMYSHFDLFHLKAGIVF